MLGRRGRPFPDAASHRPRLRPGRGPRVRAEGGASPAAATGGGGGGRDDVGDAAGAAAERPAGLHLGVGGTNCPWGGGGTRSPAGVRGKQVTGREEEEGTGGCGAGCGEGEAALLGGWARRERGR